MNNDRYERIRAALSDMDAAAEARNSLAWRDAHDRFVVHVAPDTIRALLDERDALREALETMVEMVEMNGFGRAYAMDVARAALGQDKGSGYWPEMPKNGGPDWTGFDG